MTFTVRLHANAQRDFDRGRALTTSAAARSPSCDEWGVAAAGPCRGRMYAMRWIDAYIDGIHRATGSSLGRLVLLDGLGPFSRIGSIVNIVFAAFLVILGAFIVVSGQLAGLAVLVAGGLLLTVFIRIGVRTHRGEFDQ